MVGGANLAKAVARAKSLLYVQCQPPGL